MAAEPDEREVKARGGRRFLARPLPYRTLEGRTAGGVLTVVEITARKQVEAELRVRDEELERFNRAAVGRELRMIELKKEGNVLLAERGLPPRYGIAGGDDLKEAP